jgi:hypothetical protein
MTLLVRSDYMATNLAADQMVFLDEASKDGHVPLRRCTENPNWTMRLLSRSEIQRLMHLWLHCSVSIIASRVWHKARHWFQGYRGKCSVPKIINSWASVGSGMKRTFIQYSIFTGTTGAQRNLDLFFSQVVVCVEIGWDIGRNKYKRVSGKH